GFWLSIAIMLLPAAPAPQGENGPAMSATDALSAASATVSDMRGFCDRQPAACAVGAQALHAFGQKAQASAKWAYDYLSTRNAGESGKDKIAPVAVAGELASQNTLQAADRAPAWRGPASRIAEMSRPATDRAN
ncbi:MAG: DUF5330 domain-containing protein, partial [Rhizobiales bacterium]|nr:DUF5330 domain-containing protein [Hyphomicrobiales bacterium]